MSLNILLNEIKNIVNKYKLEKRNQLKEGKSFNIFKGEFYKLNFQNSKSISGKKLPYKTTSAKDCFCRNCD